MHNKVCWACGPDNENGLRLKIERDEKIQESRALFLINSRYEGNGGVAHGGIICSVFDSVMTNEALSRFKCPVFTAKLEVMFKKKILINDIISIRCWFEKKYFGFLVMKGEIKNKENKIAAKAKALFSQQI